MQLRGPLVGPDRWWYHTLLKGTVRDTLASYGSVPESGPPLSFDQRVLEPTLLGKEMKDKPSRRDFCLRGSSPHAIRLTLDEYVRGQSYRNIKLLGTAKAEVHFPQSSPTSYNAKVPLFHFAS